jgi:hypothetical protein
VRFVTHRARPANRNGVGRYMTYDFGKGYSQSKATLDLCVNVLVRPTRISPRQPVRGRRAA